MSDIGIRLNRTPEILAKFRREALELAVRQATNMSESHDKTIKRATAFFEFLSAGYREGEEIRDVDSDRDSENF